MDLNKLLAPAMTAIGKEGFMVDPAVPVGYIARVSAGRLLTLLRGSLKRFGFGSTVGCPQIGRGVIIRCKQRVHLGPKVRIEDATYIDALSMDGVRVGANSLLGRGSRIECTGTLSSVGRGCSIGNNSTFGSGCYFGAAGGIRIGNDVIAGQNIRFHSENHNFEDPFQLIREQGVSHKGITIGNDCWIGAGAVILDGAHVGDGCVIAANAVVTDGAYPPFSVIAGVPAKIIKNRNMGEGKPLPDSEGCNSCVAGRLTKLEDGARGGDEEDLLLSGDSRTGGMAC